MAAEASELLGTLRPPWSAQGACRDSDVDFFPTPAQDPGPALELCARCPVQVECLEHALWNGEAFGVWGGLTEQQRAELVAAARRLVG